ncbi:MAG: amidase [Planctomycetota bacterium]|jgi:Asp-tRNA(Asn)/Glu-tRNA(Gln) amidotransferase A subunit family amidase|nr:amidase [Planctomycetota bacterium]
MTYERTSVAAPRLAGISLRLFAWWVERPILGWAIRKILAKQAGFTALGEQESECIPLWAPLHSIPESSSGERTDPAKLAEWAAGLEAGSDTGFRFETIQDFRQQYLSGRSTPLDLAGAFLAAVERSADGVMPMGIFVNQYADDLLRQAEASTDRYRRGESLGPLDGVPVAVKDELDQIAYPTTAGTRVFGKEVATRDATSVARLRAAGALLVGKTNMHELGAGVTGLNPHHGPARNPYDPTRLTGGSSSATAASVAAGLCPVAIGCDGGGSIRIPASLCGIVGLKATFGRVSEHGAFPLCWSVGHVGPFGATARDAATAYALIAGPDPSDPHTHHGPDVELSGFEDRSLAGVRLGWYGPWFEDADSDVVRSCREHLEFLASLGAEIVEVEVPRLDRARVVHLVTIVSEMCAGRRSDYLRFRRQFGHDIRVSLAIGYSLTGADYVHALRHRRDIFDTLERILGTVDGIITPSTACTAPTIPLDGLATGETNLERLDNLMRFAPIPNLTGHPAISFPVGYDSDGLPIGCQVIGRAWSESFLLRLAHLSEAVCERRKPVFHEAILASISNTSESSGRVGSGSEGFSHGAGMSS